MKLVHEIMGIGPQGLHQVMHVGEIAGPPGHLRAVAEDPAYGRIVCRCEQVTEAEIVQSIRRKPGARDMDGVKRRTRAGMGRCQSGFCMPRVAQILARELGVDINEVTKCGEKSFMTEGYIDERE